MRIVELERGPAHVLCYASAGPGGGTQPRTLSIVRGRVEGLPRLNVDARVVVLERA